MLDARRVPTAVPGGRPVGGLIEAGPDELLLRVPGVARYHVRTGFPVAVAAEPGVADADVACFLAGPVRAAHLLVHGVFALRATAVRVGDGLVAVTGPPAVGKSVLGAALALRGHPVLADGVLPVQAADAVLAWPTGEGVVLWPPAARRLGIADDAGEPVRSALPKRRHVLNAEPVEPTPLPLRAIVTLTVDRPADEPSIQRVAGGRPRMSDALAHGWHPALIEPLGLALDHFAVASRLAESVAMLRLSRPNSAFTASRLAELVEAELR